MKKTMFGLCKECCKIKKYENVEVQNVSVENTKLIYCEDCFKNDIIDVDIQKQLFI